MTGQVPSQSQTQGAGATLLHIHCVALWVIQHRDKAVGLFINAEAVDLG